MWVLWAEALPDSGMLRVVMVTVLYCLSVVVGTDEKPAFSAEVCFMKELGCSTCSSCEMDSLPRGPSPL